jgi:hypothetical protein
MRGTIAAVLVAACLLAGCSYDGDDGDRSLLDSLKTAGPESGDLFVYGEVARTASLRRTSTSR